MNIGLIIAGGNGKRMNQDIPKQFINVFEKPVLIYTLESFERHPLIDRIVVVCITGWEGVLSAYAKQYGISKLTKIVKGGATAQESIRNGVQAIAQEYSETDTVIIHDGIRPIIETEVLSDVIATCEQHGNGVTSLPYNEQIFVKTDEYTTRAYIPRDTLRRVQTPQAYRLSALSNAYRRAFEENIGIGPSSYTNTMMVDLGETLYFASGSERNIKLTSPNDLELFKAMLKMNREAAGCHGN